MIVPMQKRKGSHSDSFHDLVAARVLRQTIESALPNGYRQALRRHVFLLRVALVGSKNGSDVLADIRRTFLRLISTQRVQP